MSRDLAVISGELVSQQQLALDIFSSVSVCDTPITKIRQELILRKSSILINVSRLGLTDRKALNGLYFLAQQDPDREVHCHDLGFFRWLINYGSRNTPHLKKVLKKLQGSTVEVNIIDSKNIGDEKWMSAQLIGTTSIQGGKIVFEIPKPIRPQLKDPKRLSFLSMKILADFSSPNAMELYERLTIFKDEGESPWWTIDEFVQIVKSDELKIASEFKYIRYKIIEPSIEQINRISDIEISIELRKTARKYSHIRFIIKPSKLYAMASGIAASKSIYEALTRDFGLSDKEMDEISQNRDEWTDDRLIAAIDFVKHRMKLSKVDYPGKYLMKAIRDGFRIGAIEAETKNKAENEGASVAKRRAQSERLLDEAKAPPKMEQVELPEGDEMEAAWQLFRVSPMGKALKSLASGYDEATPRHQMLFRSFWSVQH